MQRLNRDGVEAVTKHKLDKAKSLFYKAYLLDPDDPFTLNNMGYVSELEGHAEEAQQFYSLAARFGTDAVVSGASSPHLEGQSFLSAVSSAHDVPMEINQANVTAVRLLSEGRAPEAELLLQHALTLDQRNPFTLNNLGVVKEALGDFEGALKYYTAAADLHSEETVVVTQNGSWRGKPVSEMAAETAKKLSQRMQNLGGPEESACLLNLRGVAALNRNDRQAAGQAFLQAYKLDPESAFTLNNLGYLAEMDGDLETAQVFYEQARNAERANCPSGSGHAPVGRRTEIVRGRGRQQPERRSQDRATKQARRSQTGPIELKRRDGKPIEEERTTPASIPTHAAQCRNPKPPNRRRTRRIKTPCDRLSNREQPSSRDFAPYARAR